MMKVNASLLHPKPAAVVEHPPSDHEHLVRRIRHNHFRTLQIREQIPQIINLF
jgi:hypothetical protein